MAASRVLITDEMHPVLSEILTSAGFDCDDRPGISISEIKKIIASFIGMVINTRTVVDRSIIDAGKNLRFIGRAGSGMEIIDVAFAQSRGIICLNSPEGNRDAVAEHTIGMMLTLLHNIATADRELRQPLWQREPNRGTELMGKTIGIFGFGNTGKALAEKLSGFGVEILAFDKYKHGFGSEEVEEVDREEIFERADIVSFHIPHTPETDMMVNESFLAGFRKPVMLINCSRGKILDTMSLADAMKTGRVVAAGLDVFESENKAEIESMQHEWFGELLKSNRVIITPHIAGWSHESKKRVAEILATKIVMAMKSRTGVKS